MSEWRVQLLGEKIDLQFAYEVFSNFDPSVIRDGDEFFLKADEFKALPEAENVRDRGKIIVKTIGNVINLHYRDARPISIGHIIYIDDSGKRHFFAFAEANLQLRGVFSSVHVIEVSASTPPHPAIHSFRIANNRVDVADALAFFGLGDWINLYKTFEIVKDDIGGETQLVAMGLINLSQMKRFTQTAQSRDAIGDGARHASKKYVAPRNPMSIHEARATIGDLLQKWVDSMPEG